MFEDYRLFFREFRRTFHTTGAVAPSSSGLGRALAKYVHRDNKDADQPYRILEVGPGTGAVTRHIVPRMSDVDALDLVEVNQRFARHLELLFQDDGELKQVAARTKIIHATVQDLTSVGEYDRIISGLPLNNFSVDEVTSFLNTFQQLLAPRGILSFFEYIGVRTARGLFVGRDERTRLKGIGRVLDETLADNEIRRQAVLLNVPPAWVHHVQYS